jgi:hypothetical protein
VLQLNHGLNRTTLTIKDYNSNSKSKTVEWNIARYFVPQDLVELVKELQMPEEWIVADEFGVMLECVLLLLVSVLVNFWFLKKRPLCCLVLP